MRSVSMDVHYDKANDLFWLGSKQLYWSSVYVLRQKSTDFKALRKKLKVSDEEVPLFREELSDLRELGLIRGKNKISTTAKGKEFLREIERKVSFKNLREKGIRDIDEVFDEAKKVYRLDIGKTKLLVGKMPFHPERVDWFPFFINNVIGLFAFLVVVLVVWLFIGGINPEEFIVQLTLSPIASVMVVGSATILAWVLYHAGQAISTFTFRKA